MLVIAFGALQVLPKTYLVEAQLLAKRNQFLSPKDDQQWVGLTESASEILHRRENLVNMVRRTNLVREWSARRAPILKFKDKVMAALFGPPSPEDMEEALVGTLDKALMVTPEEDTVTISLEWRDPEMGYRLVSAAQEAFLEERHVQEVSLMAESTAILAGHASKVASQIDSEIEALRELVKRKTKEAKDQALVTSEEDRKKLEEAMPQQRVAAKPAPQPQHVDPADLQRLSEISVVIEAKDQMLDRLTQEMDQRLTALQVQLSERKAVYTDAHPIITDLKQQIQSARIETPQVAKLRSELSDLRAERNQLEARTGETPTRESRASRSGRLTRMSQEVLQDLRNAGFDRDDPEVSYARSKLDYAIRKFHDMQGQIDGATIDLDTAQAAFKYRYRVITPAVIPPDPIRPLPAKVLPAALIGGLALGLLIAIALELRRDLIHQPWQIEQTLALPVVASVELLAPPPPPPAS